MFNKCRVARDLLGITQKKLAEITGVHVTVIARRETKVLGISGVGGALYSLIIELAKRDTTNKVKVMEVLEAIEGEKAEEKAFAALLMYASGRGYSSVVRQFTGDDPESNGGKEDDNRMNVAATLDVLSSIRKDLEKEERYIPDSERKDFESFALDINNLEYRMKRWVEKRQDKQEPPDKG